jgi:hypothetical protein
LIGYDGEYAPELDNYRELYAGHVSINIYNINLFVDGADPSTLLTVKKIETF